MLEKESHYATKDWSQSKGLTQPKKLQSSNLNGNHHASYLLALSYSEQISAGLHSVLQLATLAHDFGAHLVEPTVVASHIFGIEGVYPQFYNTSDTEAKKIKMFGLFNQSRMNNVLHSGVSPTVSMVPFPSFLKDAPQDISIFHFNSPNLAKASRLFTLPQHQVMALVTAFEKNPEKQILDCRTNVSGMRTIMDLVERRLNMQEVRPFKVTEVFCFNHNHIYRSDQLLQLIPAPRTIIFTNWGGCGLDDCSYNSKAVLREKDAMAAVPHIRHAVLTKKKFKVRLKEEHKMHNKHVQTLAQDYLRRLNLPVSKFIAVHIRMERIVRKALESKVNINYTKCLNTILNVIDTIINKDNPSSDQRHFQGSQQILAMSDMPGSEFGSDTCSGRYCNLHEVRMLYHTLRTRMDFQSFEPGVLGMVRNAGLVSLVEMQMLSMGKKLVLVGFGGFQAVLKSLFLSRGHNEGDVHHVTC